MVTTRMLLFPLLAGIYGCSGKASTSISSIPASDGVSETIPTNPSSHSYDGHGFVVHEWGTDTIVVGSDGSMQPGLHHEEEDLPAFVYDRVKSAGLPGGTVDVKMETPVTYFYSDAPLRASAKVEFPNGFFTQWFPQVEHFSPPLILASTAQTAVDPLFTSSCVKNGVGAPEQGVLDWGEFDVLAPGSHPLLLTAPLDKYTWSHAREVAANHLQTRSGELEHFLFYRGLGNFNLPVTVRTTAAVELSSPIALTNTANASVGDVFVIRVNGENADFIEDRHGIASGATLRLEAPSADPKHVANMDDVMINRFAERLSVAVTGALDRAGLYHDEAVAMVHTWSRQWFRTPGLRVLYIAPETWTNASIPLTISPTPREMKRVMLVRVEALTPEQEASDVGELQWLESGAPSASQTVWNYFSELGRFEEPRFRRAMQILGDKAPPEAKAHLKSLSIPSSSHAVSE